MYSGYDGRRDTRRAIAFFLLPALKQYIVVPVAMFVAMRPRPPIRALIVGASVAAMTVVPFIVWNWHATVEGIVFQMRAPTVPRSDRHGHRLRSWRT